MVIVIYLTVMVSIFSAGLAVWTSQNMVQRRSGDNKMFRVHFTVTNLRAEGSQTDTSSRPR